MVKKTGPTTLALQNLIKELFILGSKENVNLWKRIAQDLSRPTRIRRAVNIDRIERYMGENETALVPGKVLSDGELTKNITVAAYQFSAKAKEKINKTGKAITIKQLMIENPKGSKVRIIG
ncbi:50S ribosomal protein L18e [Candidatus Woesearchaeota archaeon]|nr:50S ribosomal protein L18e [Candidatus Woesearchaeota archaeon]